MRIVSGIQPTGNLHLGNYLGAIRQWVVMQDEAAEQGAECLFFLADLHAITMFQAPQEMRDNVRSMAAALMAAGIDPAKSILFNQTRVPETTELTWLLMCVARIGWLNRMTQFKEKSGKNREGASAGLYTYPVLMAADVLLYNATHVPVGEDQKQHLELARDIATKFNQDFGVELFTLPEPKIGATAARVMSLRDGTAKMSKSDPSDMARINLSDDDDAIAQKVKKAKSDAELLPATFAELAERPEARNLVSIYAALSDESADAICARFAGQGFGAFKPALAEVLVESLRPIRDRYNALRQDHATIDAALEQGAARARQLAKPQLEAAQAAMGLFG